MKKAKWVLSVFLTITMLMSSFVAAVGETLEEGQPAAQTTETDGGGGGGGHDRTTSGGGGHANTKTGGGSKHDNTGTPEGGRHDNTGTVEGGRHDNTGTGEGGRHDHTGTDEGGGHDHTGTDEGGRHDNPGTDEGGGHDHTGTDEGSEGGNGNAGTGEGGEGGNSNAGTVEGGEGGNGNAGTDEGENDPIDLTGENGDEGEELMLLGAALLMAPDALLDEGIQPRAIEPSNTYVLDVTDNKGNPGTLTLKFEKQPDGTYKMIATLSDDLKYQNAAFDEIIIYDNTGNVIGTIGNTPWNGSNPREIPLSAFSEDGWIEFSFNGQSLSVGKPDHVCDWQPGTPTLPTCVDRGYTTSKCSICDKEGPTTWTDPKGHAMVDTKKDPTCVDRGYTTSKCSVCGEDGPTIWTDPKGHAMVDTKKDPTCVDRGYTTSKCSVCGEDGPTIWTDPKGHAMVDTKKDPTCTERGYTTSKCSVCGEDGPTIWTDPKGHAMVDTKKDPTCTERGYTTSKCSVCGEDGPTISTPATGHSWEHVGNTSEHACGNAGCTATAAHSMKKIGSANGVETWKCRYCDYKITITIASPNPVNPVNPGNGLATIGDEQIPLGLDMVALRMLDENLRITNSLTLGDILNDNLVMDSALEKDGYILELNFGALQYLSITYPSGKYVFLTDNLNAEIPFSLCSELDGLAEYLQENVISADNAWLRVTFTQTSSGWNATMSAFDDEGQPLGYDIEDAGTSLFQIK